MAISRIDYLRALNPSNPKNQLSAIQESVIYAVQDAQDHSASATQLADMFGMKTHTAANTAFNGGAKKIATELGLEKAPNSQGEPRWWPHVATMPGRTESGSPWKLLPNFVAALEEHRSGGTSAFVPSKKGENATAAQPAAGHALLSDTGLPSTALSQQITKLRILDQFDLEPESTPQQFQRTTKAYHRNPRVREAVKERAGGACEWCGIPGFPMRQGVLYLETHHVVPLSEGGSDLSSNVMALCPNHHREAHHGLGRLPLRAAFLEKLRER